jgi:phosphate-selective porin OprO and OprP
MKKFPTLWLVASLLVAAASVRTAGAQEYGAGPYAVPFAGESADGQLVAAAAADPADEAIRRIVDQRLKEIEAQKKADEAAKKQAAAERGYEVGTDLSIKGSFKDGLFPWLETPNKDFTMHISCWTQWDNVWWNQSPALTAPVSRTGGFVNYAGPGQGVASGPGLGGIGDLQDGVFFRRIRPNFEGTFWETYEYRFIPAFENNQFNTAGIDEMWVGARNVPVLGKIRVGHVKNAMGLEGDMTSSSRCMTFMERSAYSESIEMSQNFLTGIWFQNAFLDERTTYTLVVARPDQGSSTDSFFGDGQWALQGRLTGLPIYEDEGRHLLHLGASGGFRNGTNVVSNAPGGVYTSPWNTVQLRARPEMRDDVPAGSLINADNTRLIDTGVIASDAQFLLGLETLYIRGPFSFQAEYGWNWVQDATGILPGATAPPAPGYRNALVPAQNYVFSGGYLQVAYTLTGENRAYDKAGGTLARAYFGKAGPYNRAWVVRDEDGHLCWNWGAWEVAARYSYVDLNDGAGLNAIQGGRLQGVTLGLNWYLNNNLSVNFDWAHDTRYDTPAGVPEGTVNGFGTRVQFQF